MRKNKLSPEIDAHIHQDFNVTPERVDAFTGLDRAPQLLVIAELRRKSQDQSSSQEFSVFGLVIAILALLAGSSPNLFASEGGPVSPMARVIVWVFLGIIALVILAPSLISLVRANERATRAAVWLGAFESALAEAHRSSSTEVQGPESRWPFVFRRKRKLARPFVD